MLIGNSIFSFVMHLFKFLPILKIVCILLFNFRHTLYTLNTNPLSGFYLVNIISQSEAYLLIFLLVSLMHKFFFIFILALNLIFMVHFELILALSSTFEKV